MEPRFFKALAEPARVAVLARLAEFSEPTTVTQVAACCPQNLSVISRHLAALREAGIVEADKRGKEVYYALKYRELAATLRAVADAIESCCPESAEADLVQIENNPS